MLRLEWPVDSLIADGALAPDHEQTLRSALTPESPVAPLKVPHDIQPSSRPASGSASPNRQSLAPFARPAALPAWADPMPIESVPEPDYLAER